MATSIIHRARPLEEKKRGPVEPNAQHRKKNTIAAHLARDDRQINETGEVEYPRPPVDMLFKFRPMKEHMPDMYAHAQNAIPDAIDTFKQPLDVQTTRSMLGFDMAIQLRKDLEYIYGGGGEEKGVVLSIADVDPVLGMTTLCFAAHGPRAEKLGLHSKAHQVTIYESAPFRFVHGHSYAPLYFILSYSEAHPINVTLFPYNIHSEHISYDNTDVHTHTATPAHDVVVFTLDWNTMLTKYTFACIELTFTQLVKRKARVVVVFNAPTYKKELSIFHDAFQRVEEFIARMRPIKGVSVASRVMGPTTLWYISNASINLPDVAKVGTGFLSDPNRDSTRPVQSTWKSNGAPLNLDSRVMGTDGRVVGEERLSRCELSYANATVLRNITITRIMNAFAIGRGRTCAPWTADNAFIDEVGLRIKYTLVNGIHCTELRPWIPASSSNVQLHMVNRVEAADVHLPADSPIRASIVRLEDDTEENKGVVDDPGAYRVVHVVLDWNHDFTAKGDAATRTTGTVYRSLQFFLQNDINGMVTFVVYNDDFVTTPGQRGAPPRGSIKHAEKAFESALPGFFANYFPRHGFTKDKNAYHSAKRHFAVSFDTVPYGALRFCFFQVVVDRHKEKEVK